MCSCSNPDFSCSRIIQTSVKETFKDNFDVVFEHLTNGGQGGGEVKEEDLRSLMFGDYMNPDLEPEERVYEEVMSLQDMYGTAEQCLEEFNNTHKKRMNLVIFRWVWSSSFDHFYALLG